MRPLHMGFFASIPVCTFLLLVSSVRSGAGDDADYKKRLSALQEKQIQTQALLNQIGGFSPAKHGESPEEQDAERKRPLFKVHSDLRSNRIALGSVYRAYNQNRLIVGGEPSPAILQLYDDQGKLSGLKLIANARPSATDGRIHLEITRIVLKSGRTIVVNAVALDTAGSQGLHAQVFSGKALAVLGSIGSSFVAGVAATRQTQSTNAFGFSQSQPTGRNAVLGGIAQTAADQSKRLIEEATNEKAVLVLENRTPIAVFFQEEVKF